MHEVMARREQSQDTGQLVDPEISERSISYRLLHNHKKFC